MSHAQVRRVVALSAAVGIALVGLVACGDDVSEDEPKKSADLSSGFSVLGALAQLPTEGVDGDSAMIQVADLDAATAAVGMDRPSTDDRDAFADWASALTGVDPGPVFVPIANGFNATSASPQEFAEIAGWSINDVATFADVAAPPTQFTVVTGLDEGALADSLIDSGGGIRSSTEGEDFATDLAGISAVDRLGRPIRFQQDGDQVGFGTSTPLLQAWQAGRETFADVGSFAEVAAALDEEDVVSAVLARAPRGGLAASFGAQMAPEQLAALEAEFDPLVPQDPYDVVGIGWSADGEVHIAYHFGDDDAATTGAEVLEQAWREGRSVSGGRPFTDLATVDDAGAEESVAMVTVRPVDQRAATPFRMLIAREFVFASR